MCHNLALTVLYLPVLYLTVWYSIVLYSTVLYLTVCCHCVGVGEVDGSDVADRRGNIRQGFEDFYLTATARIWL